jgi:hypothetical protein
MVHCDKKRVRFFASRSADAIGDNADGCVDILASARHTLDIPLGMRHGSGLVSRRAAHPFARARRQVADRAGFG